MSTNGQGDGVSRLQAVAEKLENVYPAAGDALAKAVAPIDEAIRKIGLTYCPDHYAEQCCERRRRGLTDSGADAHPFCFHEEATGAEQVEYGLCAARGSDDNPGLYVSACTWGRETEEGEDADGSPYTENLVVVSDVTITRVSDVRLPIRVKILDVLDEFVDCYLAHVKEDRANLLNGSIVPEPSE